MNAYGVIRLYGTRASIYTHVGRYCGPSCQVHDRPRIHRVARTPDRPEPFEMTEARPAHVVAPMSGERRKLAYEAQNHGRALTIRQLRQLARKGGASDVAD
jgi:hypothetical protein